MQQDDLGSDIAVRVLALLRHKMKVRGHGTMASVQRKLGLRRTYFSEPQPGLEVALVIQVLRHLDIKPGEFFDELEGYDSCIELPDSIPEGLEGIADYYRKGRHLEETDGDS